MTSTIGTTGTREGTPGETATAVSFFFFLRPPLRWAVAYGTLTYLGGDLPGTGSRARTADGGRPPDPDGEPARRDRP